MNYTQIETKYNNKLNKEIFFTLPIIKENENTILNDFKRKLKKAYNTCIEKNYDNEICDKVFKELYNNFTLKVIETYTAFIEITYKLKELNKYPVNSNEIPQKYKTTYVFIKNNNDLFYILFKNNRYLNKIIFDINKILEYYKRINNKSNFEDEPIINVSEELKAAIRNVE